MAQLIMRVCFGFRRATLRLMRWVIVALGVVGCGNVIPIAGYCQQLAQAQCEGQKRCRLISDAVDCTKRQALDDCLAHWRPALAAGVVTYDGAAAASCLAKVREAECSDGFQSTNRLMWSDDACRSIVLGKAKKDETCGACGFGLGCLRGVDGCGVCKDDGKGQLAPLPVEGEPCTSPIVDGAGCQLGLSCVSGLCVVEPALGEACDALPCRLGSSCVDHLCVAWGKAGMPCGPQCENGLACDANGICVVPQQPGTCAQNTDCATFSCVEGVCVNVQQEGMRCSAALRCDATLACVDAQCVKRAAIGEPCEPAGCAGLATCIDGVCHDPMLECR